MRKFVLYLLCAMALLFAKAIGESWWAYHQTQSATISALEKRELYRECLRWITPGNFIAQQCGSLLLYELHTLEAGHSETARELYKTRGIIISTRFWNGALLPSQQSLLTQIEALMQERSLALVPRIREEPAIVSPPLRSHLKSIALILFIASACVVIKTSFDKSGVLVRGKRALPFALLTITYLTWLSL
jgi:hypothetical protein